MAKLTNFKAQQVEFPTHYELTDTGRGNNIKNIIPAYGTVREQGTPETTEIYNGLQLGNVHTLHALKSTTLNIDYYSCDLDGLNDFGLNKDLKIRLTVDAPNTNAGVKLRLNNVDYTILKEKNGQLGQIEVGDFKANKTYELTYNGSQFIVINLVNTATETEAGLVTLAKIKETVKENAPSLESYENIVNTHARKNIDTEEGAHGLRYYDKKLQIRKRVGDEINGEVQWEKVETGDPWENNLEKLIGMPYGGTIQGTSSKEVGKFYYDTSTKEYYECIESNNLNYAESSKYRSMSRKNVGKGEIEAWDTTKNSKLYQKDINSPAYSAYDVGSFEIGNFIIKFGRTSSSIATQYFPTPFPNKCISVVLTPLRRVDIYTNIDVYSYNNKKFTYVGELHKINGICWIAIGY